MNDQVDSADGIVTESSTHDIKNPVNVVAEVEQHAPDAKPVEENTPEGDEKPSDDGSEKVKRPGRRERQLERERQENLQLRAELDALKAKPSPDKSNTDEDPEPQESDYENAYDHVKALAKWEVRQSLKADKAEQMARAEQVHIQDVMDGYEEVEEVFAAKTPDYAEKVAPLYQAFQSGQVAKSVGLSVMASEMGPEIAYYFANTQEGLNDLHILQSQKDNPQLLRQSVRQIEAYLKSNPMGTAVKQTRAAAPITPVTAKSSSSTKNPVDMDQKEYEAWRYK